MSLQLLPEELLFDIIGRLPSHHDVFSLSLQNRRIHRLCDIPTRRRYHRIRLGENPDLVRAFDMLLSILQSPRLGQHVRHIELRRSRYPIMVDRARSAVPQPSIRRVASDDLDRIKDAIRNLGFGSTKKHDEILNLLLQDAITMRDKTPHGPILARVLAMMLVSVSLMLESLILRTTDYELPRSDEEEVDEHGLEWPMPCYLFQHFLRHSSKHGNEIPFLQNLHTVRFIVDGEDTSAAYYQPEDLYSSLNLVRRLPAVESVRVDAISDEVAYSPVLPPRSANYSKIELRHCSLSLPCLVYTIQSVRRLEEFTYTVGGRATRSDMLTSFHPERLFRALFPYRSSLCKLDLDVEGDTLLLETDSLRRQEYAPEPTGYDFGLARTFPDYLYEWEEELAQIPTDEQTSLKLFSGPCSLRDFSQLKSLSLGVHILYLYARGFGYDPHDLEIFSLVDHLPPCLETLRIYGYEKGMEIRLEGVPPGFFDRQLAMLVEEKAKKLPRLTVIEGIEELIPNGRTPTRQTMEKHKLWNDEADVTWVD